MKTIFALTTVFLFLISGASAQQIIKGSVANIEESKGTITIQQLANSVSVSSPGIEDYRLQDGLLFNALRIGDKVTFTAETINGAKTITSLSKD